MSAFAALIRRSAAAMSGRRSSSSLGKLTGKFGIALVTESFRRELKTRGGLAAERGERVQQSFPLQIQRGQFRLGDAQLRFRLRHVEVGNNSALAPVLRQLQRTAISRDRVGHQRMFRFERAQHEIIAGHFRLERKFGGLEIVRRRDEPRLRAFAFPAHAAPQIQLPTQIQRGQNGIVSVGRAGGGAVFRRVHACALARDSWAAPKAAGKNPRGRL